MMMKDAQGLPFVGRAASFLLTHAPVVSGAYANLRAEEHMKKVLDRVQAQIDAERKEEAKVRAINERLEAKIDKGVSDLFDDAQKKAALSTPKVKPQDTHHPDYAALLTDVAAAATRFVELAGPHLAKIEGDGNWQQVFDANMAVVFALERAVVALVRSTQSNLASEPTSAERLRSFLESLPGPPPMTQEEALALLTPEVLAIFHGEPTGPCPEQKITSVSLRSTMLIHACWRADHLWLGFCSTKNEATRKSLEEAYATCDYDTGYERCMGLTEEQRLYLQNWHSAYKCPYAGSPPCLEVPALRPLAWDDMREELAEEGVQIDAADWLSGEDK